MSWQTEPLSKLQIKQMETLMDMNPDADQMYVETVIRCPPDKLAEIVKKHKEGLLKNEPEPEMKPEDYIIDGITIEAMKECDHPKDHFTTTSVEEEEIKV